MIHSGERPTRITLVAPPTKKGMCKNPAEKAVSISTRHINSRLFHTIGITRTGSLMGRLDTWANLGTGTG